MSARWKELSPVATLIEPSDTCSLLSMISAFKTRTLCRDDCASVSTAQCFALLPYSCVLYSPFLSLFSSFLIACRLCEQRSRIPPCCTCRKVRYLMIRLIASAPHSLATCLVNDRDMLGPSNNST